jgi:single-stranded DNA-binding protein
VNKVLLTGRLTRDPEMRALASGKHVTSFSVATNEYVGNGREKAEYHSVIAWVSPVVDSIMAASDREPNERSIYSSSTGPVELSTGCPVVLLR